jgi:protoheme IX farnesyltransferase
VAVTAAPPRSRVRQTLGAYVALTKPRIIELLLITTVPPMVLAAHERSNSLPSFWLVVATMFGGTLAAASANTINCFVDRDIDALMHRTSKRPLVQRSVVVSPANALRFGLILTVLATGWLGLVVNWPAALLADAATAVYVFVYTLWLKRRTPSNIVIGGAAGCFPVFVGWAAVTGGLDWPAVVLFAVVFLWTPPHFWALAIRYKDDYAAAGVPMLPVVRPAAVVARHIVTYSWLMVGASLLLIPLSDVGWLYGAAASVAGAVFLAEAHGLSRRTRNGADPRPMRLFHLSITYLTVVFLAAAVSPLI